MMPVSQTESLPLELGVLGAARVYFRRLFLFVGFVVGSLILASLVWLGVGLVKGSIELLRTWKFQPYYVFPEGLVIALGFAYWRHLWTKLMETQTSVLGNKRSKAKRSRAIALSPGATLDRRRLLIGHLR